MLYLEVHMILYENVKKVNDNRLWLVQCFTFPQDNSHLLTGAPPMGAGCSTFSYLILNCKQFTKLYILLTCQQIGVNTFYKCIAFQVNSFDSYWEILIILKKYPIFLCTVKTRADNSGYTNHRVTCLVVMDSPFDSEQVCWVSFQCLS